MSVFIPWEASEGPLPNRTVLECRWIVREFLAGAGRQVTDHQIDLLLKRLVEHLQGCIEIEKVVPVEEAIVVEKCPECGWRNVEVP